MANRMLRGIAAAWLLAIGFLAVREAHAQPFGVELHNTLMPASGGMGGVSIARPQDLVSAINANPAALTQFRGTQFTFSGAWAEPTFNLTQTSPLPLLGVDPYSAKSSAPGAPVGNIGVTQDFSALGLPATFGIAFLTTSGGNFDFRSVPESNGTNTASAIFSMPVAIGVDMTERFHLGASFGMGIAYFDAPFVGVGGMTPDYAVRGTIGANYDLTDVTTVGMYYQSGESFQFDNAIRFGPAGNFQAVQMDLPQNIGFGLANRGLMEGRLLIATDILYKLWDQADLFDTAYRNQWVVQIGSQYDAGRYKLRMGYAWVQDPIDPNPGISIGGVNPPGAIGAVRYSQALLAITGQHRVTAGIGMPDVLPGVDLDLMAGGMFHDTEQIGPNTQTSIVTYWLGLGLTWRFGRGACERMPVPNDWGCGQ